MSLVRVPAWSSVLSFSLSEDHLAIRDMAREFARNEIRDYRTAMAGILREPSQWPNCCVYLYVILVTRLRAYWLNYTRNLDEWERDESSRSTTR